MGRVTLISCIKRYLKGLQPINITVDNHLYPEALLLSGKIAIVTGASRGIGFAIAKMYVEQGARVVAIAKTKESLDKAKERIGNRNYIPLPFDLTLLDSYAQLEQRLVDAVDGDNIDILVNAAGIKNGQENKYWDFTVEDFEDVINVNVKAPFFLSRMISKHMIRKKVPGHIINIIGIKGSIGEASPYSISKFGLSGLTQGMARMMAPNGIIVNGISPGATKTGMTGITCDNYFHTDTANGRIADPAEIANIAVFLASNMASNLVGSIIVCDGGEMLQYQNKRF